MDSQQLENIADNMVTQVFLIMNVPTEMWLKHEQQVKAKILKMLWLNFQLPVIYQYRYKVKINGSNETAVGIVEATSRVEAEKELLKKYTDIIDLSERF